MKAKIFLLCLFIILFGLVFICRKSAGADPKFWIWYQEQNLAIRQGIAEMAKPYKNDAVKFVEYLFLGIRTINTRQPVIYKNLKLKVMENDGLVERISLRPRQITGWRYRYFIADKELTFFFPKDRSFFFGIEMENKEISLPSKKLSPAVENKPSETTGERGNQPQKKPPLSDKEQETP